MRNEALVHTAAMLACAAAGLAVGGLTDAEGAETLVEPLLMCMLVFVFLDVEPRALRGSLSNVRYAGAALAINFLLAPLAAAGLGLLFYGDSAEARVGLMMLLAMPCTDWYLVFTASAKGDVALGASLLPANLVLQVLLIPLYVRLLVGGDAGADPVGMLADSAAVLAVPAAVAACARLLGTRSERAGRAVSRARGRCGALQLVFLCGAVACMFAAEADPIAADAGLVALMAAPMLAFFAVQAAAALLASRALSLPFDEGTSLMFTSAARNSPLALAIAAASVPDATVALAMLAAAPLIELPVLSAMSALRLRARPGTPPARARFVISLYLDPIARSAIRMAAKKQLTPAQKKLEKVPVKDIKVTKAMTVDDMLKAMGRAGGFTAQKLSDATDIAERMVKDKKCLKILSFPACIMATGTRGVIVDMVKNGMVDVIITTCGCLDHDLSRLYADYYKGDFMMDDALLRQNEVSRLGNVLVPDSCYGEVLEDNLIPMFDEIFADSESLTTHEIIDRVGARLESVPGHKDSLLWNCHEKGVPIVVPGITDGSFGCQLWMYYQLHRKLRIDLFGDEQMLSEMITDEAEKTGAIIIGGGISKHHVIWWNQFRGGLDYCIYLTTAEEYDGSLSGARIREAVSWGKVKPTAKKMTVEGDATITLPLIYAGLANRLLRNPTGARLRGLALPPAPGPPPSLRRPSHRLLLYPATRIPRPRGRP